MSFLEIFLHAIGGVLIGAIGSYLATLFDRLIERRKKKRAKPPR